MALRRWHTTTLLFASLLVTATLAAARESQGSSAEWYAAYRKESRLVSIPGGRTLNLYCEGSGSPAVILESGISESAFTWWKVQREMAESTQVCAYDRAGLGYSPPGPFPRDTQAEVDDLHALLTAANVRPPYVLVGHSMGGYNVRLFASRHPDEVAGLVLIDPAVENQVPAFEAAVPAGAVNDRRQIAALKACADPNRTAKTAASCTPDAPEGFPPALAASFRETFGLSHFQTVESEVDSFLNLDSAELVKASHTLGSMPLIVLTRGNLSSDLPKDQAEVEWKLWNQWHEQVAKLSSAGTNRVISGSGHYIQIDKPQAVIDAVLEVVGRARVKRE